MHIFHLTKYFQITLQKWRCLFLLLLVMDELMFSHLTNIVFSQSGFEIFFFLIFHVFIGYLDSYVNFLFVHL